MSATSQESEDDGQLDGCEIDFTKYEVDDEEAMLTSMFEGVPEGARDSVASFYREVGSLDA